MDDRIDSDETTTVTTVIMTAMMDVFVLDDTRETDT